MLERSRVSRASVGVSADFDGALPDKIGPGFRMIGTTSKPWRFPNPNLDQVGQRTLADPYGWATFKRVARQH